MFIQTESTPNPATLKFLPGQTVMAVGTADFPTPESGTTSPLAKRVFAVEGTVGVFFGPDFVTVTKAEGVEWDHIKPALLGAIMEHFQSGQPVSRRRRITQPVSGHAEHTGEDGVIVGPDQRVARHSRPASRGPGWRRHHVPRLRPRGRLPAHARRLCRLPLVHM